MIEASGTVVLRLLLPTVSDDLRGFFVHSVLSVTYNKLY
jgi:hypothetical protein